MLSTTQYEPYEVREAAENLKLEQQVCGPREERTKIMNSFPWLQSTVMSLGGLGKAAIKLFAKIARSQASSIGTLYVL